MMQQVTQLTKRFDEAIAKQENEIISDLLQRFDEVSRLLIESETDLDKKREIIQSLVKTHDDWQQKLLQNKAKVQGELADIKSNGKKINKYLTSF